MSYSDTCSECNASGSWVMNITKPRDKFKWKECLKCGNKWIVR